VWLAWKCASAFLFLTPEKSKLNGSSMAQVEPQEIIRKAVASEVPAAETVAALIDRDKGTMRVTEGQLVDFKGSIDTSQTRAIGELAKDVLGFSNAQGGFLLFGIDDTGKV